MAQTQGEQVAPFTKTLLSTHSTFLNLLPATARDEKDDLHLPGVSMDILDFLGRELQVPQLNKIHSHLWKAGRPMPARNLGCQLVLSREIVLTEDINLHLIWKPKRMYLKPLPKYLLIPETWSDQLVAQRHDRPEVIARRQELNACARGLLFSYCSLFAYESEFTLAQKLSLIPEDLAWLAWKECTSEILSNCPYHTLNPRYWYGELRLSRLNSICRFQQGKFLRGYSRVGSVSVYSELLSENFGILAAILGYVVIVLTAMQVGLATTHLSAN